MKWVLYSFLGFVGLLLVGLGVAALIEVVKIIQTESHPFTTSEFWRDAIAVMLVHVGIAADVYCARVVQRMEI